MKRLPLAGLVAVVGVVIALFVPAIASSDDWPPPVTEIDGAVYLLDANGYYNGVPDFDTALAMGVSWCPGNGDWCGAVHYGSIYDLPAPVGGTFASCGCYAIVTLPDGALYQYDTDDGLYHHAPDPDTAFANGINWCGDEWCGTWHMSSVPGGIGDEDPSVNGYGSHAYYGQPQADLSPHLCGVWINYPHKSNTHNPGSASVTALTNCEFNGASWINLLTTLYREDNGAWAPVSANTGQRYGQRYLPQTKTLRVWADDAGCLRGHQYAGIGQSGSSENGRFFQAAASSPAVVPNCP